MQTITNCSTGIKHIFNHEKCLVESGLVSNTNPSLLALEKSLLDLAAYPDVARGVFYLLLLHDGNNIVARVLQSGICAGLMESKMTEVTVMHFKELYCFKSFVHFQAHLDQKSGGLCCHTSSVCRVSLDIYLVYTLEHSILI